MTSRLPSKTDGADAVAPIGRCAPMLLMQYLVLSTHKDTFCMLLTSCMRHATCICIGGIMTD